MDSFLSFVEQYFILLKISTCVAAPLVAYAHPIAAQPFLQELICLDRRVGFISLTVVRGGQDSKAPDRKEHAAR